MRRSVLLIVLALAACAPARGGKMLHRPPAFEQQLATLDSLGIRLRPGITAEDLLTSWGRAEYEQEPFRLLLVAMGAEQEREPYARRSDDVWHFDTECIEGDGSYADIARRIDALAGGAMRLADVRDHVDLDAGSAWLAFRSLDRDYRWQLEVQDDWVDVAVFTRLDSVLSRAAPGRRILILDLHGQDCLLLVGDERRLADLRRATGLDFAFNGR